jgi:hypothetical protein
MSEELTQAKNSTPAQKGRKTGLDVSKSEISSYRSQARKESS